MTEPPELIWTPDFKETHVYYDAKGSETLSHSSIADYVYEGLSEGRWDALELLRAGISIEVYAYDRVQFDHPCEFLDDLLCNVSEDPGMSDPEGNDGDYDRLSKEAMAELRALEQYVASRIKAHYKPWGCIPVLKLIVPFSAFFDTFDEKTRSDLLSGGDDD